MYFIRVKMKHMITAAMAVLGAACSSGEDPDQYVGYVEAEYTYIAAPQSGWLNETPVREGDRVSAGDLLFSLDKDQQEAQLAAARARAEQAGAQAEDISRGARAEEIDQLEANLEAARVRLRQAKLEYDRWIPLVREGNATEQRGDQVTADYRAAKANFDAAEDAVAIAKLGGREGQKAAASAGASAMLADLREAEWRLEQRGVHAERAAVVQEVFHRKGEYVTPAAPVMAILPDDGLKVRFFVPQDKLEQFAVGEDVSVAADGLESSVRARVSYIAKEAEFTPPVIYSAKSRKKLVFLVEARIPAGTSLRPGLPVDVSL